MRDFDSAVQDADEAIRRNNEYLCGYFRKAVALRELGRLDEAIHLIKGAPQKIREDEVIKGLLKELEDEYALDNILPEDHPEMLRYNKFIKWFLDGGARFNKVKLRFYSADHRGIHAKQKLKRKEVLIFIPKELIITLEIAKEAPVGDKIKRAKLALLSPKHCFLSTYLLQEMRNPDSKWKPFLDMLPKSTNNFPIFFTEEEMEWLKGSPFQEQVKGKVKDIARDYAAIVNAVSEFARHSLKEFSHARMLISSRIFGITVNRSFTDALVPLADMFNFQRHQQTSWSYKEESRGFVVNANEPVSRGDELYESYGNKCNSRFFLNYGFVLEDNTHNEVPITISLDQKDPLYASKLKMLDYDDSKAIRIAEDFSHKNLVDFFSFLRLVKFRGDLMILYNFVFQQGASKRSNEHDFYETYHGTRFPPLSVKNEVRVLKGAISLAKNLLDKYATSYEEDRRILEENKELTFNQRNCVVMRAGEKKILLKLIDLAKLGLELIKLPFKKAKEVYEMREDKNMYRIYVVEMLFPFMHSLRTVSYTHLTLPTNREV
eukprot:TRINITY_DN15715_c0_g1_i11.p1 TRINITY_DN15715_c0_g1~~TRINITY_DN15715_c0_g1_i11.p1  ORF type:complete len:547 (-),score=134.33 TRINITY_DN15715_c0_g1_i11:28-1668(-)